MRDQREGSVSLGLVGGFALALTVFGVYGSVAHLMACRRRETAVRLALGAGLRDVIPGMLGGTLGWVAVGLGVGALTAAVWARLAGAYLYGVSPHDWASYVAVIGGVAAAALVAGIVAVVRAGRMSPSELMRGAVDMR